MAKKLNTYTIEYDGKEYICAEIPGEVVDWDGYICIGCSSLNQVLYDEEEGYASSEAQMIDETIWGYLPEENFNLSYKEFVKEVRQNLY